MGAHPSRSRGVTVNLCAALAAAATAATVLAASASAHVERTSQFPDPAPDASVSPAVGGKPPKYRSRVKMAETRVVCQKGSYNRLRRSLRKTKTSKRTSRKLLRQNRSYRRHCKFSEIQPAVDAAENGDRIVIMPGIYTEPTSRAKPHNDPACAGLTEVNDTGSAGAPTYEYHVTCPNDINLVAVMGRDKDGKCIKCGLQIEGSGRLPDDTIIEAGDVKLGMSKMDPEPAKEVGLRVDRADGTYMRNFTVRHAEEHGIYVHEADGYVISKTKGFYNHEYGFLMFTSDHGVTKYSETVGNGDSGIYPGAAPETKPRLNQLLVKNKSHHNTLGYSGTMGNNVHIRDNDFYDNAAGLATDSFFAGGHPGFPQDSAVFEGNRIYSNNFNVFKKGSDVPPTVPVPVGTGLLIAGGNENQVRGNRIYDNWRRGTMLLAVPDALAGETGGTSTSFDNRYTNNIMGIAPDGTKKPNGVDFWWDEFAGNTGNCWQDNGEVTSDPPSLPDCDGPSVGTGHPVKEAVLARCAMWEKGQENVDGCDWFTDPPQPGSSAARIAQARELRKREDAGEAAIQQLCVLASRATANGGCLSFDRP